MKGDVGRSSHEKEREQEDAYTKRVKKSFNTPSLHLCFFEGLNPFYVDICNPRRACAARVTVLGLWVSVSVFLYSRTAGNDAAYERCQQFLSARKLKWRF